MKLVLPFVLICLTLKSFCQMSSKEVADLQTKIHTFFYKSKIVERNFNRNSGNSEVFFCLLKTDENGNIKSVNLLSDNSNIDSGYAVLQKLSPMDFSGWQSQNNKRKTLVMPLVVLNNQYQTKEWVDFLTNLKKMGNSTDVLNVEGIVLTWPITYD